MGIIKLIIVITKALPIKLNYVLPYSIRKQFGIARSV